MTRDEIVGVMADGIRNTVVEYSIRLVSLNEDESIYRLTLGDEEDGLDFPSFGGALDYVQALTRKAEAESALTALEAAGMVVVPREPTEEMIAAGRSASVMHSWTQRRSNSDMGERISDPESVYAAMLAASPTLIAKRNKD